MSRTPPDAAVKAVGLERKNDMHPATDAVHRPKPAASRHRVARKESVSIQNRSKALFGSLSRALRANDGFSPGWQIVAFLLASILVVSRDPSLFRHSQFYAEDGRVWYAQAYNAGWLHSLVRPEGGYLNTLQRVAAGVALLVPFRWAPLAMAFAGLVIQALPVPILLSDRCRHWMPLPLRVAVAAVYIGIPNSREIHIVCTNSQWHLALTLLLVALAAPPRGTPAKVFDICILTLAAVSGPFAILSLPLVACFWFARRQRWTLILLGILLAGSAVQVLCLQQNHEQRLYGMLGATPALFVRLLGGNAFIGALLGSHRPYGLVLPFAWSLVALVLGLAICGYCARFASLEIRLFFVYCFAIFAAGLRAPLIASANHEQWRALLAQTAQRYSFFPGLALLLAIVWCAASAPSSHMRIAAWTMAMLLCVGIYRDWNIAPLPYMDFSEHAAVFKAAPPGTHVLIPIYPDWTMELIKKAH